MASQGALEADAIFKAARPDEYFLTPPPVSGFEYAIRHGATPQQASDQAWYFIQHAVLPDGKTYGSYGVQSTYVAWTVDHGAGQEDGFGWGLTPEAFAAKYSGQAGSYDPMKPQPGYWLNPATGLFELKYPGTPDPLPGYQCGPGSLMDANGSCWPIMDERFFAYNATVLAKKNAGTGAAPTDAVKKAYEDLGRALGI